MALCHQLGCLPGPGGLLDQDPVFVRAMAEYAVAVEKRKADNDKQAAAKANRKRGK